MHVQITLSWGEKVNLLPMFSPCTAIVPNAWEDRQQYKIIYKWKELSLSSVGADHSAFECNQETLTKVLPPLIWWSGKVSIKNCLFSTCLAQTLWLIQSYTFVRKDLFCKAWKLKHAVNQILHFGRKAVKSTEWWCDLLLLSFFFWCVWNASVMIFRIKECLM